MADPRRGDIWLVDLSPTPGHEGARRLPALVVSADPFNMGPAGMVLLAPLTTNKLGIPLHVEVQPPEAGVKSVSFITCEGVRSVAKGRLSDRWGSVSSKTMAEVEERLRLLLDLA